MRHTTRRKFLAQAAGSAAGVVVCAGVWPGLKNILAADSELTAAFPGDSMPQMQFPTAARERIAIASYPFREYILGRGQTGGSVG
ncbi:MAG TPA: ubiquinol-cytochrome c reductase iron-sulfur subunit N-terminal domain-containing protein, partial [Candidatus Acidoferrum sp.]